MPPMLRARKGQKMNFTPPNITNSLNFTLQGLGCVNPSGVIKAECIIKNFCPQIPAYILTYSLIIIAVFIAQDLLLPRLLYWLYGAIEWESLKKDSPFIFDRLQGLLTPLGRVKAAIWVKDRLLFFMAVFCGFLVQFSLIQR